MPVPAQTPAISVAANNGGVSVLFTGTVVSTASNGIGINFYRNSTNSTTGGTLIGTIASGSTAASYFDTTAPIGTQVWYYAKYYNSTGEGTASTTAAITVPAAVAATTQSQYSNVATVIPNYIPSPPSSLVATGASGVVNLAWINPGQLGGIVVVRRLSVGAGAVNAWSPIATLLATTPGSPSTVPSTYSDTTVTNGTQYDYAVYATP